MCSCLFPSRLQTAGDSLCPSALHPWPSRCRGRPFGKHTPPATGCQCFLVCDSLERKEVFLGVNAFAQNLQKNICLCVYIYIFVYIYKIINHLCPWESLEWIENVFHCNIDCIEAHCSSTEEAKGCVKVFGTMYQLCYSEVFMYLNHILFNCVWF